MLYWQICCVLQSDKPPVLLHNVTCGCIMPSFRLISVDKWLLQTFLMILLDWSWRKH